MRFDWRQMEHMFHRLIHATRAFVNPSISYSCDLYFDGEAIEGFFDCVQRMVLDPNECLAMEN